jgi:hypothetical protein
MVVDAFIYERAQSIGSVRLEVREGSRSVRAFRTANMGRGYRLKIWDGKWFGKV